MDYGWSSTEQVRFLSKVQERLAHPARNSCWKWKPCLDFSSVVFFKSCRINSKYWNNVCLRKSVRLEWVCMTSEGAFALFHVDNCPHLNRTPTIGNNWHVASAVLGEIWGCTRPQTGCPFHQLERWLPVGAGAEGGLLHCYLVCWSKWCVEIPFFSPLASLFSLFRLPRSRRRGITSWEPSVMDPKQRLTALQ